jgi:DNA modification methylase
MDSVQLIKIFLGENGIKIDPKEILQDLTIQETAGFSLTTELIPKIIADSFNASNQIVSQISRNFKDKHDFLLGRVQKSQLKKYLDYEEEADFDLFIKLLDSPFFDKRIHKIRKEIDEIHSSFTGYRQASINRYINNLKKAIIEGRKARIKDYLVFLYSRLLNFHTLATISLEYLFQQNEKIIKKELESQYVDKLKDYTNSRVLCDRDSVVKQFSSKYLQIVNCITSQNKDQNAVVYVNISQKIFNKFVSKQGFYSYLLDLAKLLYEKVENHKALVFRIQNVNDGERNIKWELYSHLVLFCEKFIRFQEKRPYYSPSSIFVDCFEFRFDRKLSSEETTKIKNYYDGFINLDNLLEELNFDDSKTVKRLLKSFKKINSGFTYIDTLILRTPNTQSNRGQFDFIRNEYELLVVFFKNEFNDYKIPCPVCGSLRISGNSFPEMGIRSWECKNPYCAERSKTNRGKRYSIKTIMMQNATYDFSQETLISRDLLHQWRRDVVNQWTIKDLYLMLIKYYSYKRDQLLIINSDEYEVFEDLAIAEKRKINTMKFDELLPISMSTNTFSEFFDPKRNVFFSYFMFLREYPKIRDDNFKSVNSDPNKAKLIVEDCNKVLQSFESESIDHMVTSPPYFNVREYSVWSNLFNYLNDMFIHITAAYNALKPGSIYFFNIGDIYNNEKIIVKSKVGDKRIPLSAYFIFLFQVCGFELLENIIWDKGEPQTSRHKNDGKFVPFYQRPTNCYEHMLIFKRKGQNAKINPHNIQLLWKSNIQRFSPVIKIGRNKVNRYGHSAPFPEEIPNFSIQAFTQERDLVVDPFSGSFTSMICASALNRHGIGIEINREFVSLSVDRATQRGVSTEIWADSE